MKTGYLGQKTFKKNIIGVNSVIFIYFPIIMPELYLFTVWHWEPAASQVETQSHEAASNSAPSRFASPKII